MLELRRLPLREAQYVVDDIADRSGIRPDDLREALVLARHGRRFREQLARVAHGANRVSDLVGDTCAQAAERRELRLLHLLREQARVFEKHEDGGWASDAERGEISADHAPAIGRDECRVRGRKCPGAATRALAPSLEKIEQSW